MSLQTRIAIYYGHSVTKDNYAVDFDEGGAELQATLRVRDYTLTEYAAEVKRALDAVGALTYTVTIDRDTRQLTISAPSNFTLRTNTGTRFGTSAYPMMGFSTAADHTGDDTYEGENGSGSEYVSQTIPKDYVAPEDWENEQDASVNVAASGRVQVLTFGQVQFFELLIWGITDIAQNSGSTITTNGTGRVSARNLMKYLKTKQKIEFMRDISDRDAFEKCLLESSPANKEGTEYKLKEIDKWRLYYDTGLLKFRVVTR